MSPYLELVVSLACAVAGVFLVLNGPLFIASHIKVFKHGPSVPDWNLRAVTWLNRIIGAWAMMASIALLVRLLI